MRVLLSKTPKFLLRTVRSALRHPGFAVDTAAESEEGPAEASESDYDVIVLDIMLPKLDGLTLLRRLRASGKSTHVLLTARDTAADRVEGLRQGADDYLAKPFALAELIERVKALLVQSADGHELRARDR
jgi:two-component system, OmpR family, response regulator